MSIKKINKRSRQSALCFFMLEGMLPFLNDIDFMPNLEYTCQLQEAVYKVNLIRYLVNHTCVQPE